VIDPVSVGAMIAALAASKAVDKAAEKAAEKVGERAAESGWGLGARIVDRVRCWFDDTGQADGLAALEAAESTGAPESAEAKELAEIVAGEVRGLNPDSKLVRDLSGWLEAARNDDVLGPLLDRVSIDVRSTSSSNTAAVTGNDNVVVQGNNGPVNITQTKR